MNKPALLSVLALASVLPMSAVSFNVSSVWGGGAAANTAKYNFDSLTPGSSAPVDLGAFTVSFSGGASAVTGSLANRYAAPVLTGANGVGFGAPDQANGVDKTTYLATGLGKVTFAFDKGYSSVGLLWGSVDKFNSLWFYNGATLLGSISGATILNPADGNQGAAGTRYVNIGVVGAKFDKIVAASGNYSFEIDNLSIPVPDAASTLALSGIALLGFAAWTRNRR